MIKAYAEKSLSLTPKHYQDYSNDFRMAAEP